MKDETQIQLAPTQTQNKISPSDLKILLWDIDGTLLQSTKPGSFKEYFAAALEKVFGTKGKIAEVKAAGATDTQIVFQALEDEGFTIEKISARMPEFVEVLCVEMKNYVELHGEIYEILPGVKEILRVTDADSRFVNALLTGNVGCGAEIKCRAVGVWQYFGKSLNTYGDISHDRRELAVAAGKNFSAYHKTEISPAQFTVIGDTPSDVATARHFGAKVISVETGRGIEPATLEVCEPDFLVKDLSDTRKILEIFESL